MAYATVGAGVAPRCAAGRPAGARRLRCPARPPRARRGVLLPRRPCSPVSCAHALLPEQALAGDRAHARGARSPSRPPAGRLDVVANVTGPVEVVGHRAGRAAWTLDAGRTVHRPGGRGHASTGAGWPPTPRPSGPTARSGSCTGPGPSRSAPAARVLPRPEQLRSLLDPPPRAAAGTHASPARGGGLDFAELRPLVPGDRLSEVNWRASARRPLTRAGPPRQRPAPGADRRRGPAARHRRRRHRRARTLAPPSGPGGVGRSARPTCARHDRVGLVTFGGSTSWITAQRRRAGGLRAARQAPGGALGVRRQPLPGLAPVPAAADGRRAGRGDAAPRRPRGRGAGRPAPAGPAGRRPRRRHRRPAPDRPPAGAGPAASGRWSWIAASGCWAGRAS